MSIVTAGINLANTVFAVYGVDAAGKPLLVKSRVVRDQLAVLIAELPPCLIGMECRPDWPAGAFPALTLAPSASNSFAVAWQMPGLAPVKRA